MGSNTGFPDPKSLVVGGEQVESVPLPKSETLVADALERASLEGVQRAKNSYNYNLSSSDYSLSPSHTHSCTARRSARARTLQCCSSMLGPVSWWCDMFGWNACNSRS